jgi:hypothetical protein
MRRLVLLVVTLKIRGSPAATGAETGWMVERGIL